MGNAKQPDEQNDTAGVTVVNPASNKVIMRNPIGEPSSKKDVRRRRSDSKGTRKTQATRSSMNDSDGAEVGRSGKDKRRTRIPDRPAVSANLWSVIKGCVGKDLSKIPMPVTFSEPLSMLQRLAEKFEHSELLDKAAKAQDSCSQMAYVAAYSIACYSNVSTRLNKPFNPLLGETYEFDRSSDLGWKLLAEQVSHHPPASAFICEGKEWKYWQTFRMSSKFRGQIIQIIQQNTIHLEFNSGAHYTWNSPVTTIHNIILGKLWADLEGTSVIQNSKDGTSCALEYIASSSAAAKDAKKVAGYIVNKEGTRLMYVEGQWDTYVDVKTTAEYRKIVNGNDESAQTLWRSKPDPVDCAKYYWFSEFACQLNEPEKGVAPTDCRRRPDQRLMEDGDFDSANRIKVLLEEVQRSKRRPGYQGPPYEPVWFKKEIDPTTKEEIFVSNGKYWSAKRSGNWNMCPDIFTYETVAG